MSISARANAPASTVVFTIPCEPIQPTQFKHRDLFLDIDIISISIIYVVSGPQLLGLFPRNLMGLCPWTTLGYFCNNWHCAMTLLLLP